MIAFGDIGVFLFGKQGQCGSKPHCQLVRVNPETVLTAAKTGGR
jgi:hypothetical protein